ncbi:MAG: hypothetical protein RJA07_459 [Bacteroidota bacterium]|jgi:hypothetical protein
MSKKIILLLVFVFNYSLLSINCNAQIPTAKGNWQWINGLSSGISISMMRTDTKGNTYACGKIIGNGYIKTKLQHSNRTQLNDKFQKAGDYTAFIAKYDCNGGLTWFKQLADTAFGTNIGDIVLDSLGNIYAMGNINYGYGNTYWDDSIIIADLNPNPPPNGFGTAIVLKINNNGKLLWQWTLQGQFGLTTQVSFAVPTQYLRTDPSISSMLIQKDTLVIFSTIDSGINNYSWHSDIFDFNTNTGLLFRQSKIFDGHKVPAGAIVSFTGFGQDMNGKFLLAANIQNDSFVFLDSSINIPTTTRGFLFNFSRKHLEKMLFTHDMAGIQYTDFNTVRNGFDIVASGGRNNLILGNYVAKTYSTSGSQVCSPIFSFKNIDSLKWVFEIDTTYDGGILGISKDINNNVYGLLYHDSLTIINHKKLTTPFADVKEFPIQIDAISGNILKRFDFFSLANPNPNFSSNYCNYNNIFSVNEKGEIISNGNFANNTIYAGKDTAIFHGGGDDMFIIKYGYPCSSDSALIEPVATDGLVASCAVDSIKLTWNDYSNIEWGYKIYRNISPTGTFTLIDSIAPNKTMYYDKKSLLTSVSYWYKVAAYNNVGTGIMSNIDSSSLWCKPVGVNEIKGNGFVGNIYPNPSPTGTFTLTVQSNETGKAQLQISNYMGQIILDENVQLNNINQWHLDLSKYSSGTYLVTLKTASGNFVDRVVVVR